MKIIRSWLFVPADSEKKLARSADLAADALILDLEDAVLPRRKSYGRKRVREFLKSAKTDAEIWVRINPLDSPYFEDDLSEIVPLSPAGLVLPKPDGPVDIETLSQRLEKLEKIHSLSKGGIRIHAVATETARAVTSLGLYPRTFLPRLTALSWGAEDLATDLGALTNKDENGDFAFTYQMVRSQTLLAAKASGVQAVETIYADFRDGDGLRACARRAFSEGFTGMLAIHPAQIEIINESFSPDAKQIAQAKSVLAAFADADGAGAVSLNGKMLDIPHLKQAQYVIALAKHISKHRTKAD